MLIVASILVAVVVAWKLFQFFFDDWAAFLECWRTGRPGPIYRKRAEYLQEKARMSLYIMLSAGSGLLTYVLLTRLFQ